jgi:hypothetical protein
MAHTRAGDERHQVNAARIALPRPLAPGDTVTIRVAYKGPFVGATEVWPYMHDRVSEDYALLRPDAIAYPLLLVGANIGIAPDRRFSYDLRVRVPSGMVVASGGRLVGTTSVGEHDVYAFQSTLPSWRMDIAAGQYRLADDPASGMRAYYFGEDASRGQRAIDAGKRGVECFGRVFGPPASSTEFTIIEVPNRWGSQKADGYILQESSAFDDPAEASRVYHEVGHAWNALAAPSVAGTRYFDEAFASYFQALGVGEFEGATALHRELDSCAARTRTAPGATPPRRQCRSQGTASTAWAGSPTPRAPGRSMCFTRRSGTRRSTA